MLEEFNEFDTLEVFDELDVLDVELFDDMVTCAVVCIGLAGYWLTCKETSTLWLEVETYEVEVVVVDTDELTTATLL